MPIPRAEVEQRLARFRATCRQAGVKLTHQRLEIFREVAASPEHPDAEMVFRAIRPRMPTASLDTVYRTLWLLERLGLVRTLDPRRESLRFDANMRQHHHCVCVRCGLTRDFESPLLDGLRLPAAAKNFGTVVTTHVEVRGVCADCSSEKPSEMRGGKSSRQGTKRRKKR